ncbi:hypothetical protein FOG51_01539 [Hanseniaspora uvarum]|nr:hypothetical protein FOG51_01539 [Hanseniaspora uvarum]
MNDEFHQSFQSSLYNLVFKRNATYVTAILFGAFAFQPSYDVFITKVIENNNQGKLWKDVKAKLGASADEDDDE